MEKPSFSPGFQQAAEKVVFSRLLKEGQMQVESAKSRLRGRPKSFVENGFKPFPTVYASTSLAPCFDTTKGEGNAADGHFSAAC